MPNSPPYFKCRLCNKTIRYRKGGRKSDKSVMLQNKATREFLDVCEQCYRTKHLGSAYIIIFNGVDGD